jgi:hypothetical protein
MTKYKFQNFNVELIDPVIETVKPSYVLGSETVIVTATLNASGNRLFGVFLGQMENTEDWGDKEVMAFAVVQLETFKVIE